MIDKTTLILGYNNISNSVFGFPKVKKQQIILLIIITVTEKLKITVFLGFKVFKVMFWRLYDGILKGYIYN